MPAARGGHSRTGEAQSRQGRGRVRTRREGQSSRLRSQRFLWMRLALTPAPLPSGAVSLRRLELAVVLHPEEPARLPSPKPRIDAARGEERAVRALLLDAPLVEDDEPVERRDG